jgi:hypothetical protein
VDSVCFLSRPRPAGKIVATRVIDCEGYDLIAE